jgi:hypothetical protein
MFVLLEEKKIKTWKVCHEQICNNKQHIHVVEESTQHKTVNIKTDSVEAFL